MLKNFFRQKLFKDSFVYMVGTFVGGFLNYLFQVVVSRQLTVGQYGELQSLLALATIFSVIGSALSYFIIKYAAVFARAHDYRSNLEFISLLRAKIKKSLLFLLFILLLLAPVVYFYLHLSDFWGLIFVNLSVVVGIISIIYQGDLTGWEKFFTVNVAGIFGAFLRLVAGVAIAWIFPRASIVIFSILFAALGGWWFLKTMADKRLLAKKLVEPDPATGEAGDWQKKYFSGSKIKKSILPIFIFSTLMLFLSNLDILLVKNLTSAEITGYYSVLSLLGKIVLWVNAAIVAAILPAACAKGYAGEGMGKKIVFSAYGGIALTSIIAVVGYYLFPTPIVNLLFGAKYAFFAADLWLFGLMAFILSLLTLEANFAYARHDFRVSYILGLTVVLMAFGVYSLHMSIEGIIWAIIVAFAIGYAGVLLLNLLDKKKGAFVIPTEEKSS